MLSKETAGQQKKGVKVFEVFQVEANKAKVLGASFSYYMVPTGPWFSEAEPAYAEKTSKTSVWLF